MASEGDVDEVAALLDAAERVEEAPDGPERQTALRALAFRLLAADQPRLAPDGLLELRRLAGPIELTTDEITTLYNGGDGLDYPFGVAGSALNGGDRAEHPGRGACLHRQPHDGDRRRVRGRDVH